MNTQVHIFQPSTAFVHIVITPSTESVTYIFTVDLFTGCLLFSSTPYVDIFKSHRQACTFIVQKYNKPTFHMQEWQGKALIGITIENQYLVIGLIEGARKCATLPNGSLIKQVNSTNFITIPLKSSHSQQKPNFSSFPINKMHFYCETMDITRPYPSEHSITDYDESFCWNQRWRLPFARFGVEYVCIVLLQGYAKTSTTSCMTYIIRRSVLNPYTRYTSRGTDEMGSPGNESECELIFYDENENGDFQSNCWRRGSIPMMWKTVVGAVGSGQHIISQEQGNVTSLYFHSISERFENIPITVVSLLSESEVELNEAYKKAVKPLDFVDFQSFDIQAVSENARIEQFQLFMKPLIDQNECFTIGDQKGIQKRQKQIFRFNCVDSTDRTNLATFVYGRILTEMKRGPLTINPKPNDFLANAFIKGGDVISILYTSTEATLTKPIRDTTQNISSAKHDASIACIRRVNHFYGNDAVLDKSIENWISIVGLNSNPLFSLDNFYLSLVQDSSMTFKVMSPVDPSVISFEYTSTKVESIDGSFEMIIELPMPMVIGVLRMMFLPHCFGDIPKSFTLECGMNSNHKKVYLKDVMMPDVKEPTFVKYSFYHSYRWGIQAPLEQEASEPVRFIWITFKQGSKIVPSSTSSMSLLNLNVDKNSNKVIQNHNVNPSSQVQNGFIGKDKTARYSSNNVNPVVQQKPMLSIGNVLIDAYIPSSVTKMLSFENEGMKDDYKRQVETFLKENNNGSTNDLQFKSRSIDSFLRLELFRIKNKIPLHVRNQIFIEKGINPIVSCIRHYLHIRTDRPSCYFCQEQLDGFDIENKNSNLNFVFHENFKSVLTYSKSFPFNQSGVILCKKCRDKVLKFQKDLIEIDSLATKEEPPRFSLKHWKLGDIKEQVCLSRRPLSTFLEFPPSKDPEADIDMLLFSDDDDDESDEASESQKESFPNDQQIVSSRSNSAIINNNGPNNGYRRENIHGRHNVAYRNSTNVINAYVRKRIANYNSCLTADVIQCDDVVSRSVEIDINDDTYTYISNHSDDDVINQNQGQKQANDEQQNDTGMNLNDSEILKEFGPMSYFQNNSNSSIIEDKSKIKYIIDSTENKVFTFTLCLSSFSVPTELILTFDGDLPEKVEIIAFKHQTSNANNCQVNMPRSTSTVADNSATSRSALISPSSSAASASTPKSKSKSPFISPSTSAANASSVCSPKRVIIHDNIVNHSHLSLPPTSASISELNPRKHSSFIVKHEDKIYVKFDPIQTSYLTFVMFATESQNQVILKHVKVLGNFVEKPLSKPSWYSFPVSFFKGDKMAGVWDPETQTHTFSFRAPNVLRRVNFKVPYNTNYSGGGAVGNNSGNSGNNNGIISNTNCNANLMTNGVGVIVGVGATGNIISNMSCGNISGLLSSGPLKKPEQMPQSILLALYNDKKMLVKSYHILIPQPQPPQQRTKCKEVEMYFQIADSPVFSTIKLFYLDLIDKLKPFEVSFFSSFSNNDRKI